LGEFLNSLFGDEKIVIAPPEKFQKDKNTRLTSAQTYSLGMLD